MTAAARHEAEWARTQLRAVFAVYLAVMVAFLVKVDTSSLIGKVFMK